MEKIDVVGKFFWKIVFHEQLLRKFWQKSVSQTTSTHILFCLPFLNSRTFHQRRLMKFSFSRPLKKNSWIQGPFRQSRFFMLFFSLGIRWRVAFTWICCFRWILLWSEDFFKVKIWRFLQSKIDPNNLSLVHCTENNLET